MAAKVSKASASWLNASDDHEGVELSTWEGAGVIPLVIFEAESLSIGIGYPQREVARSGNVQLVAGATVWWVPHRI